MSCYVDSSVLLRVVLRAPGQLEGWERLEGTVTSELARVECLRTLDRLVIHGQLDAEEVPERMEAIHHILEAVDLLPLTPAVLARAAQRFSQPLGTLDAIHLATALLWRDATGEERAELATHDVELARAARAVGFEVLGVPSSG